MPQEDTKKCLEGVISLNSKGAGFIRSKDVTETVEISHEQLNTALHGDVVEFCLNAKRPNKPLTGSVQRIVVRSKKGFAGILEEENGMYFLVPQDKKMYTDIIIPKEKLNSAEVGQKVFAVIENWNDPKKSPFGTVEEVLGKPGINDVEMRSIALEKGFSQGFPKEVEDAAQKLYEEGLTGDVLTGRRDFRDVTTFTIDPFDAKDFDDALSFKKLNNGNFEVGVHIADVSHYVAQDSPIDKEAVKRQTSVYLVDRVIPMLPEVLSNDLCSLVEAKDRLTYAAVFEVTKDAQVVSEWFGRTIINSDKRFTYEEAQEIIEQKTGLFAEELTMLNDIAKKLHNERFENGAISLDTEEVKFKLDEKSFPISVYVKERKDAHKMIEEWMLLANRKVAEFVAKKSEQEENVFVYRIHDLPDEEKMLDLSIFLKNLGYNTHLKDGQLSPRELNKILEGLDGKPEKDTVQTHVTRSMQKAVYSTNNIGHYGLAFEYYTHFTSPIRRYADVMVHRLLEVYLKGGKLSRDKWALYASLCNFASSREKEAADAERSSIKYKQVEYMSVRLGKEFDGVISGLSEWGVYVSEKESHCEGMVKLGDLGDDYYSFDEKKYEIKGEKTGEMFKLGQAVRFKVVQADLERKIIDYALVRPAGETLAKN